MNEKQEKLLGELHQYAYDVKCDWSGFDGRELLRFIKQWIADFNNAEGESK